MSTAKSRRSTGEDERRAKRRRRKVAAATSTMLLVAAAVAGEPVVGHASQVAGGVGGGLHGLTDPDSVGASGEVGEDDRIGDEVLRSADNIDRLRRLGPAGDLPNGPLGIPGVMLEAYMTAAEKLAAELPSCRLHWSLLASIGRIESNHARGGQVDGAGNTTPQILGPVLNGGGFAAIRDTDGGSLDSDGRWDRAVGAMQFIPSTWRGYASDGNNDGVSSPHNVHDATLAAGRYLCSGGMDLSNGRDRAAAVFRYNHSDSYVRTVLIWADAYAKGVQPLPSTAVPSPAQQAAMAPPPANNPGKPAPKPKPEPKPDDTTTTTTTTTTTSTTTTTTMTTTTTPCDTSEPPTSTTTTTTTPTTTSTAPTSTSSSTTTTTTTTDPC